MLNCRGGYISGDEENDTIDVGGGGTGFAGGSRFGSGEGFAEGGECCRGGEAVGDFLLFRWMTDVCEN